MQLPNKTLKRHLIAQIAAVALLLVFGTLWIGAGFLVFAAILIAFPIGLDLWLKGKQSVPYKAWKELTSR